MLKIKITLSASMRYFEIPEAPDEHIEYAPCQYKNCEKLVRVSDSRASGSPSRFCHKYHRQSYWHQLQK